MSKKHELSPWLVPGNPQLFGFYQWTEARRRTKNHDQSKPRRSVRCLVEKEDYQAPLAMTDIDPGYFIDLTGRPIREKFSGRRYVEQARQVLRARLLAGFARDDCMRIDRQFAEERRRFANIEKKNRRYVTAFEDYLSKDHESSMDILTEADREAKRTNALVGVRDQLSKDFGQIRLEVYQLEEMWRLAKACYDFVSKISSKNRGSLISQEIARENEKKPSKVRAEEVRDELMVLIEAFERDVDQLETPEISLIDPRALSKEFNSMELRNLDAMIHLESLAGPMQEMASNMTRAQERVEREIGLIEENLQNLQSHIELSEQRADKLEKYADYLLHRVFRELVCSESVLQLRVFIEDTYESCIGRNDASLDSYMMMRTIEKTYEYLNMALDNLPHDIVRQCEKEGFTQEMRTLREAQEAAKKFDLMHRLLDALRRIMEPTILKPRPNSLPKSTIIRKKKSTSSKVLPRKSRAPALFINKCESNARHLDDLNFEEISPENKPEGGAQVIDENYSDCREEMS
ncbi:centrosomal protein of 83 kDa-like isoform X2 [Diachasmimorpha longicaudata]